jgi:hypothetical protein
MQSAYDAWILSNLVPPNALSKEEVVLFGENYTVLIEQSVHQSIAASLFLVNCYIHGTLRYVDFLTSDDGVLASSAFVEWYRIAISALSTLSGSSGIESGSYDNRIYFQSRPYPCKSCCTKDYFAE